jgi:hypothetical protein
MQSAMRFCFQRNGDTEALARRPFRDSSSTAFVNQETRTAIDQFLTPRFVARKTFNQSGLQFRFASYLVGYRVASFGCGSRSRVIDFDRRHNRWSAQVLCEDAPWLAQAVPFCGA